MGTIVTSAEQSALTDDEAANVRRLVNALDDVGAQAVLTLGVIRDAGPGAELAARAVSSAFEDLKGSSRSDYANCALSLAVLNTLAKECGFPEDFLLSDEALLRCTNAFWDMQRAAVID